MSKRITPLPAGLCLSILAGLTHGQEAFAIPTSVVMQTVPIDAVWTADGVNAYRMDVVFDASTYPEQVSALEWTITFPDYIVFDSAAFPLPREFFFGNLQLAPISDPAYQVTSTSVSGRVGLTGSEIPNAPIGANGIAASYWFTVSLDATPGQHTFDASSVLITIYDPTFTLCGKPICVGDPESIENLPFEIVALSPADLTGPLGPGFPDGCVDAFDLGTLLGAWCSAASDPDPRGDVDPPCEACTSPNFALADISGASNVPDGCVDAFDLAKLLSQWCSVAGGNPCGTCQ
ncbi:MAG: hypothetical protein IH983_05920 [Planctomycetes bacterium]|nr:hypothetical protein [Planctomycetota bacterium]